MRDPDEDSFITRTFKIPCLRSSLLYGISCGIAGGLLHFLFTSRVLRSYHVGVGTYTGVSIVYWLQCRYRKNIEDEHSRIFLGGIKSKILNEGTEENLLDKINDTKVDNTIHSSNLKDLKTV